jgi:hypothetical protein
MWTFRRTAPIGSLAKNSCPFPYSLIYSRMNPCGKLILCTAALWMLASSGARAAAADWDAPDEPAEVVPELPDEDDGCSPCVGTPLAVYVPNLCPGWELSAGLLYLRPGADNLGWGTITTFLPLQNPQWAVQTLDPDFQPGVSLGARRVLPCSGKDVQANWEHLRTSDSALVAVDNVDTQWISPFSQTGPSTSERANEVGIFHFKSAEGQVDFDYDLVNLDVGQTVNIGSSTQVRLFAGLSFVRLREQLVSTFYNDPNVVPVPPVLAPPNPDLLYITLNNTSTYTGVGPRLGLSTEYKLCHGFTLVGQLSGAILEGWMQPAQYSFSGVYVNDVDNEQISSDSVMQVVYASDAKLGVSYIRPLGRASVLSVEAGYKAAVYMNPFSTYETSTNVLPLDIGSLSTSSMRHTPSDFTLSGLYLTCGVQW